MANSTSSDQIDTSWLSKPVTVPVALLLFMLGGGATFVGFPRHARRERHP